MILDRLETTPDELERRTGWKIEPQGACKGDRCVPLPGGGAALDVRVLAERLEMALVHDSKQGLIVRPPEPAFPGKAVIAELGLPEGAPERIVEMLAEAAKMRIEPERYVA